MRSVRVKTVRWIKSFTLIAALLIVPGNLSWSAEKFSIRPDFDCGEYLVHGLLLMNGQHQFVLKVRDKSTSPYELLLAGGNVEELMENQGTHVEVKIQVTSPIHDNSHALVLLESTAGHPTFEGEKRKVRSLECKKAK